jgi:hypothetical protein
MPRSRGICGRDNMGLTLLRYLQWEVSALHLSVKELVDRLGKIRVGARRVGVGGGRVGLPVEVLG